MFPILSPHPILGISAESSASKPSCEGALSLGWLSSLRILPGLQPMQEVGGALGGRGGAGEDGPLVAGAHPDPRADIDGVVVPDVRQKLACRRSYRQKPAYQTALTSVLPAMKMIINEPGVQSAARIS